LPPHLQPQQFWDTSCSPAPDRVVVLQSAMLKPPVLYPYPVLLFGDAEVKLGLSPVIRDQETR
jgi:hypothetical protein